MNHIHHTHWQIGPFYWVLLLVFRWIIWRFTVHCCTSHFCERHIGDLSCLQVLTSYVFLDGRWWWRQWLREINREEMDTMTTTATQQSTFFMTTMMMSTTTTRGRREREKRWGDNNDKDIDSNSTIINFWWWGDDDSNNSNKNEREDERERVRERGWERERRDGVTTMRWRNFSSFCQVCGTFCQVLVFLPSSWRVCQVWYKVYRVSAKFLAFLPKVRGTELAKKCQLGATQYKIHEFHREPVQQFWVRLREEKGGWLVVACVTMDACQPAQCA